MTSLGGLSLDALTGIFDTLGRSTLTETAGYWDNLAQDVPGIISGGSIGTQGTTSLNDSYTALRNSSWNGAGASAFDNKMHTIIGWSGQLGALMSNGNQSSISSLLTNLADQIKTTYTTYSKVLDPTWQTFCKGAMKAFNDAASKPESLLDNSLTPPSGYMVQPPTAVVTANTATAGGSVLASGDATIDIFYTDQSPYLAMATITVPVTGWQTGRRFSLLKIDGPVSIELHPGPPPADGLPTHQSPQTVSPPVLWTAVSAANCDQYMSDLRSQLGALGDVYTAVASKFPAKLQPLPLTDNPTTPGNGAVPFGSVPAATTSPKAPVSAVNQPNLPATSTNGANSGSPLTTGGAGAGLPTGGSAGAGNSGTTSLASAPTLAPPLGSSGTAGSGLPSSGSLGGGGGGGGVGPIGPGGGSLSSVPPFIPFTSTGPGGGWPSSFSGGKSLSETPIPLMPFGGTAGGPLNEETAGRFGPGSGSGQEGVPGGALGEAAAAENAAGQAAAAEAAGARSSMPMMPYMPMSQQPGGSDRERRRSAWLDEEDDLWSPGTDPAPAVIGGQS